MSVLRIRVHKEIPVDGGPPPRLVARIQKVDDRGRSAQVPISDAWVPVSSDPQAAETVALAPGDYRVEVTMPSGELLSEAFRLTEAAAHDVVLTPSPQAQLRGVLPEMVSVGLPGVRVVPSSGYVTKSAESKRNRFLRTMAMSDTLHGDGIPEASPRNRSVVLGDIERAGLQLQNELVTIQDNTSEFVLAPDRKGIIDVSRPLHWLGKGASGNSVDVLRTDPWKALPAMRGAAARIIKVLYAGRPEYLLPASALNYQTALYSVDTERDEGTNSFSAAEREYLVLRRRTGVELICLPTPWRDQWTGRAAPIDVTVQQPRSESEFASSLVVGDPHLMFLVGFLQSGALPAAKQWAEHASEMLYEKSLNPLAAAAGGYALVSGAVDTQRHQWHAWIENLMNRYDNLPDGAVQYATMRLRLRTSSQDVDRAADAFKEAYRRGLPFFGMGLRWLLDGLERLGAIDHQAREMAANVRNVTARLHPSSAFTIVRLGKI